MGLKFPAFSAKVNGKRDFKVEEALKLAEILNLDLEDMRRIWKGEK